MARVIALLTLLLVSCSSCSPTTVHLEPILIPKGDRQLIEDLSRRAVLVKVTCEESSSTGSGVILGGWRGGQLIATAAHVVDEGCGATAGGKAVTVVARDTDHDVALLWNDYPESLPFLKQGVGWLGEPVIAIGYPYQHGEAEVAFLVSRGWLMARVGYFYRISTPIYFGSSGGGLFGEDGSLVGITAAMVAGLDPKSAPSEMFAVRAEFVFALVRLL